MELNTIKNIFVGIQVAGVTFVLVATIGNLIVSKRIELYGPYYQKIKTAVSTVEVIIDSAEQLNSHFMDRGGYLVFGRGGRQILGTSATECLGKQLGNNKVLYKGVFNMDVNDPAFNKPVLLLNTADTIQIHFVPMPKESKVIEGKAICIINGSIEINIPVPPQTIADGNVNINDLEKIFEKFPKKIN